MARLNRISPLLVIVGQTASGKSTIAMQLAELFDGEIISADSWTVRAEMDIGTAKPTHTDQMLVKHHLLDIVQPDQEFSAALFKRMAMKVINEISSRGKLPILVGGTGLYINGVIYDYSFLPAGSPQQRAQLNSLTITDLLSIIEQMKLNLDGIDIRNKRRLIRFIETKGVSAAQHSLRENTLLIGLNVDKEVLCQRITQRFDAMLAAGLCNEVSNLVEGYGWSAEGLKGVGYAQWQRYFSGDATIDETRSKVIKATLDLAKRQRTWFKRNKSIHWIDTPVKWDNLAELITTFLDK